tara:strand:- start:5337 stop:6686 length:1350 start_codon:yes stop_codon:yes gene_type:complete
MSMGSWIGNREYFPGISRIEYEGAESDNPLAFKTYDADRLVGNKTMREHLRFAICYWHTFCANGADPFGPGTRYQPWNDNSDSIKAAEEKLDAAFEFFSKMTVPYFCFHDRDLAPEGSNVVESEKNLQHLVDRVKPRQKETGIKLLWGTSNMFSNPRYMNGASTNPNFDVVAQAGAQVKAALDATVELGGENFVFWGGREGYASLFNTDTGRELEHMAKFLGMARDYGRSIGFKGTFLIEPKPMEPMYHQYDVDSQTVIGFLRHHGLSEDFKINVETNHATLAGHSLAHELQMCADAGMLGSVDANRGNPQNGWDTDQFPSDLYDTVQSMLVILEDGGFKNGGLNFDAKLRRESTDLEDMFIAHIGGMDSYARGLLIAHEILEQSSLMDSLHERYASFNSGQGQAFESGQLNLVNLRDYAVEKGEPTQHSGRQEWVENIMNDFIFRSKI